MKSIRLFWCPDWALSACFRKGLSIYTLLISSNFICLKVIFLWATHFLIVSGEKQAHSEVLHLTCLGWVSWDKMNYPPEALRQINSTLFIYLKNSFPWIQLQLGVFNTSLRCCKLRVSGTWGTSEPYLCSFCLSDLRNPSHNTWKKKKRNNPWVTTCVKSVLSNFAWVIQQL